MAWAVFSLIIPFTLWPVAQHRTHTNTKFCLWKLNISRSDLVFTRSVCIPLMNRIHGLCHFFNLFLLFLCEASRSFSCHIVCVFFFFYWNVLLHWIAWAIVCVRMNDNSSLNTCTQIAENCSSCAYSLKLLALNFGLSAFVSIEWCWHTWLS